MTSRSWESWRAGFQRRVKDALSSRGLDQKTFAPMVGLSDGSSVSYHLSPNGKGPTPDFVEKVARLWPKDFGDAVSEYWAAKSGASPSLTISEIHKTRLDAAFTDVESAIADLRSAVFDLFGGNDAAKDRESSESG